jgi:hypothetical protein
MVPEATPMSYYGRPILKAVTWEWPIPAYLFTGGLAAGSAMAGAGVRLRGDRRLAMHATSLSMGAVAVSGVMLVYDLGRPERFYNMLRVFKPTSPMSVGTWIFSAFSAVSGAALAAEVGERAGILPTRIAAPTSATGQVAAAVVAPALATYTAVLVADTAVPAWKEADRHLPWVFAGSAAAAGAGAVTALSALGGGAVAAGPRRMALVGAVTELAVEEAMQRHLRTVTTGDRESPDLSAVYQRGRTARLHRAARAATVAGVVLTALGRRRRGVATAGGAALAAGSALTRFAIFEAGRASAEDPVYTVGPQKARLAARSGANAPA